MFGKAGCRETAYLHAGRGPTGMVKAGLLESQYPTCNRTDRKERLESGTPRNPRAEFPRGTQVGRNGTVSFPQTLQGVWAACSGLKGTKRAPKPV